MSRLTLARFFFRNHTQKRFGFFELYSVCVIDLLRMQQINASLSKENIFYSYDLEDSKVVRELKIRVRLSWKEDLSPDKCAIDLFNDLNPHEGTGEHTHAA